MATKQSEKVKVRPAQKQDRQPGIESKMRPAPEVIRGDYVGTGKLADKVAIVTGGDSGIGRAVAVHFAREGADIVIAYLDEHGDAQDTVAMIEGEGRRALLFPGDIGDPKHCEALVDATIERFGRLDIVVNNAAEQHASDDAAELAPSQVEKTFRTNVFAFFYLVHAALPHLKKGASILNTSSVTAFRGSEHLVDYSATKGAIVAFTRSLSAQLAKKGIRVNGVAPGPIWTPLIPATFDAKDVATFGSDTPMGRAGQPSEVAPAYVFLASEDGSYVTGQFIHPNGGEITGA
jgi:NAD(P)-dependent dehydrogenase (short-subunit alcohol dehydrogenase family)